MKRCKKYRMKFIMLIMFIFPLAVSVSSYGGSRNLSLSSEGISQMVIDCGAGFLELKGVEGLNEIRVKAEIIAGKRKGEKLREYIEKNVELSLEKEENRAVLISKIDHSSFSFFRGNSEYIINLTIEVPSQLNLSIKDGSGSIDIANVNGRVKIHDGSGDLYMDNVYGDVEVEDGSGSIDVRRLTGNLAISDGSGGMEVKKINGDLNIIDGSGFIRTSDIDGSLEIRDGSGSIYIDGVSNDVDILESGSGGVQFKNIKGRISGDL